MSCTCEHCQIQKIIDSKDPEQAYKYALNKGKRISELEPIIIKHPYSAYCYAKDIIKGRWFKAKSVIMKDAESAYHYANDVINGRFKQAEKVILTNDWKNDYVEDCIIPEILKNHKS